MATEEPHGVTEGAYSYTERECRALADAIGCTVEVVFCFYGAQRMPAQDLQVQGPPGVYGGTGTGTGVVMPPEGGEFRLDPFADEPLLCHTWDEVMERLKVYAVDLALHRLGINEEDSKALHEEQLDEDGKALWQGWVDSGFARVPRLIMADWFEERGEARLAYLLRAEALGDDG
jgi:hypothetical protein